MRERISTDNAAKLLELTRVQCDNVAQVLWSANGTTLAVADGEKVKLYAGTFGGQPAHILEAHTGSVNGIAFSPDNNYLASVSVDRSIKLWDISDIQITVAEVITLLTHQDSVNAVVFSPDGKLLATCSSDGTIQLWNTMSREQAALLEGHEQAINDVAFAIRGNVLVSGGRDKTVRLWDTTAETEGTVIGSHDNEVRAIRTNPPGTMIATACQDGSVKLWDALSGDLYATMAAHTGGAECLAFSPYGELMVTGGQDRVLRVWNVQRVLADRKAGPAQALATLGGHEKPIMSVTFNPPGTLLASGSADNTVRLWSLPVE